MAYTLAEAAKIAPTPLVRGVIQTVADAPLFDVLPFENIPGLAYTYARTAALPNATFRALNGAYPESTPTFTNHTINLAFLGGDSDVDRALVRSTGQAIEDLRAASLAAMSQAVRLKFIDTFINGDGTGESFEGIDAAIVAEGREQDAPAGGFGSTDASRADMFDAIDALLGSVVGGPDMLIMSDAMLARMKSAARRDARLVVGLNDFGRNIANYDGVALVGAGVNEDGNAVIADDSIYAVRLDVATGVSAVTNGGIDAYDLGELETKPSFRTRVEFYCGAVVKNPNAVAVLRPGV